MMDYAKLLLSDDELNISQNKMADLISSLTGMTNRYAKKYLRVCDKGSKKVLEAVLADKISFSRLYEVVKAAPNSHERQDELLSMLKEKEDGYKIQNKNHKSKKKIDDSILLISGFCDVLKEKYNIGTDEFSDVLYDVLNILPDPLKMDIVGIENM